MGCDGIPKGKSHKKRSYKLKFVRRTVGKVAPDQMIALPPLFSNFCKCFVKIKQSERNVSFDPLQRDLDAARILFNVMEESGVDGDVTLVKKSHFSIAEEFVVQRFTPSTAYRMSKALQNLAGFIDRYRLAKVRIGYKSTIKKPRSGDSRGQKVKRRACVRCQRRRFLRLWLRFLRHLRMKMS